MGAFGDELRLEREKLGMSLAMLSAQTKVNLRHLEALESGRFHELPGGVFRRGIVRAYLVALSLEESQWLPSFEAGVAENASRLGISAEPARDAWVTFASNVKKNRMRQRRITTGRWVGVVVLAALLAAAAWALWHFELKRRRAEVVGGRSAAHANPRSRLAPGSFPPGKEA